MPATQRDRLLAISTPLGEDVLLINAFAGSERVSTPFVYNVDLLAELDRANQVDPKALVGKPVTIKLFWETKADPRFYHGIVRRFVVSGGDERFQEYRAEVVPKLWLLSLQSDNRIFQNKTAPDILKQVLNDAGVSDLKMELQGDYKPWDYCVQYRETDLNFVSRLMEEEGIFYFFRHEEQKHTMVLADNPQSFVKGAQPSVRYGPGIGFGEWEDIITTWEKAQTLRPGKYTVRDRHFLQPTKEFQHTVPTIEAVGGNGGWEIYDYPAEVAQRFNLQGNTREVDPHASRAAKIRMQEEEASSAVFQGTSFVHQLAVGTRFSMEGHASLNADYAVIGVEHSVVQSPHYVTSENVHLPYSNTLTAIPYGVAYRPPRTTRRAAVQGPQTATVVGLAGEEIHTDEYGRIKIQFHWDREGKSDDKSSCWVRVAQPWAGKQWGAVFLPRVGDEVVVNFLEGDPDQPIVIGSVYNADQMPPYKMPDNKTQSGIKTRSSPGGGSANFNEIRFEDKKGSEDIYFHAEKDFHRVVEKDDDEKVGQDQTIEIQRHRKKTIKDGNETIVLDKGNRETTLKMGNDTTKISLGKSYTEAMQSIELKVGSNSIKIDQTGITLKGIKITVQADVLCEVKAPIVKVDGSGMVVIKGGITMIN